MADTESSPERRVIYRGRIINVALQSVGLADGSTAQREVVLHPGSVALVPMVDADHVCLIENERFVAGKALLEVPAGTIDPGETPEQTAARELIEETGYRAGRLVRLKDWYVSPGFLNERMSLFLCEDLQPGPPEHQPDERLKSVVVSWDEALRMAQDGRIEDAKTLLALFLCDRLRKNPPPNPPPQGGRD